MPLLDDRKEHHSELAEGVSANVPTTDEVQIKTPEKICGMGHRMKRKEDPRFIQGKGNYVDVAAKSGEYFGKKYVGRGSAYADYSERADVQAYVDELVREHGFEERALLELFSQAERKDRILESIARPAERTLEWHEYRQIFVKEPRISQGVAFWNANQEILEAAEARYGVAPEYVVAIIGVETRYGRITGSYRVLDALMTLAFDYPPRSSFFRKAMICHLSNPGPAWKTPGIGRRARPPCRAHCLGADAWSGISIR